MTIQVGDVVGRLSYDCDVLFRVLAIERGVATLVGEEMRLLADAPVTDLKKCPQKNGKQIKNGKKSERMSPTGCFAKMRN